MIAVNKSCDNFAFASKSPTRLASEMEEEPETKKELLLRKAAHAGAPAVKTTPHPVRMLEYDMSEFFRSCVERYVELAGGYARLTDVPTPFLDEDHLIKGKDDQQKENWRL